MSAAFSLNDHSLQIIYFISYAKSYMMYAIF
jgi:hypothetical protein